VSAGGTVNAGGATHPASGGQSSTDAAAPRTDAQVDASQDVAIDAKRPCVGQVPCCGDGVLDGPGGPRNLVVNGDFETGDITGWVLMIGGAVEQGIVAAPLEVQPTLTGFVYRIRPGREYFNAGIAQNLILDVGQSYSFTVAVGSRELQHVGGRRASFEIWIDGTTQATVTHLDSEAPTQELLTGAFVATKQHTEARLVFNRENLSATANPEWTADRVSVVAGTEQCDDGVNDGLVCNPDCTLP